MNRSLEQSHGSDDGINLAVYLGLLLLTAATLTAGVFTHHGRILAVSVAVIIATAKAGLIAFYYMGLRRERLLTYVILALGLLAVLVLLAGIYPDASFQRL